MTDHSKLELFNKHLQGNLQGTLVGNWWEEREMRIATDVGRTVSSFHIPKVRQQLFSLPPDEIKLNDPNFDVKTADRIFCNRKYKEFKNINATYGSEKSKTDRFEKFGKRTKLSFQQNLDAINQEQNQQKQLEYEQKCQRHFQTTQREYHGIKVNIQKTNPGKIGRMIMKDQNNNDVYQQKEDPYYAELNRIQRPILSKNIQVDQNNYLTNKQATYYEEKKNIGNFYRSSGDDFKLNNQFIKSYSQYTHKKL